MIEKYNVSN